MQSTVSIGRTHIHNAQCCLTLMTHFLVAGVIKEVVFARRRVVVGLGTLSGGEGKVFLTLSSRYIQCSNPASITIYPFNCTVPPADPILASERGLS